MPTSIGLRLEFWQKSLRFFAEAPLIGHGTGLDTRAFRARPPSAQVRAGRQIVAIRTTRR